jgi:hypothetical protein
LWFVAFVFFAHQLSIAPGFDPPLVGFVGYQPQYTKFDPLFPHLAVLPAAKASERDLPAAASYRSKLLRHRTGETQRRTVLLNM